MGTGSPANRRKRKRTQRANIAFMGTGRRSSRASLPCFAVLFGLALIGVVCVHKYRRTKAVGTESSARGSSSSALAKLLQEQHEIDSQAARYADPATRCLPTRSDYHREALEVDRLGPFTCVADAGFFLRVLSVALNFPILLVMDVGPRIHTDRQLLLPQKMAELETRIRYGEDAMPSEFGLGLVNAIETLSVDAWSRLIISLVQVMAEGGAIVIRGPSVADSSGRVAVADAREGSAELREATLALTCSESGVATAVGDLDGGIVVVRRAAADETTQGRGCQRSGKEAAAPERLQFENLFLWVTGGTGTIETVQDMFGGADAIRKYARRRSGRADCFAKLGDENTTESLIEFLGRDDQRGSLRKRRRVGSKPISSPERAARCLENHLREHPQDVRAAFALEMVLRALDGKNVDHQVKLLQEKVYTTSGQSGISLWKALHARTAVAAATGLLP